MALVEELHVDLGDPWRFGPRSDVRAGFWGPPFAPKHSAAPNAPNWFKDEAWSACMQRGWLTSVHDEAEAPGIMDFALYCLG